MLTYLRARLDQAHRTILDNPIKQAALKLAATTPGPALLGFGLLFIVCDILGTFWTQKRPTWARLAVRRNREAFTAELTIPQLSRHRPRLLIQHFPCKRIVVFVRQFLYAPGFAPREILALFDPVQCDRFPSLALLPLFRRFALMFHFVRCGCDIFVLFLLGGFSFGFLYPSLVVFVDLGGGDIVRLVD